MNSQACWLSSAGRFFDFSGLGKPSTRSLRLLLIRRHRRYGARKSGCPTPFELSLKVQRDFAHNPPSGFEVLPRCYDLNVHEARKVHPTRRRGELAAAGPCDGTRSPTAKPSPAALLQSWRSVRSRSKTREWNKRYRSALGVKKIGRESHGEDNALPEMRKTTGPDHHLVRPHRPSMHKL